MSLKHRSPTGLSRVFATGCVIAAASIFSGCSVNQILARAVADQLAQQSEAQDDDLELSRDAAPFFLKFGESVLTRAPDHDRLSETLAAGFARYAWAFLAFEADRIETQDLAHSTRLRQRAVRLYARAEGHAMRALERHYPGLSKQLAMSSSRVDIPAIDPRHAGLAYWAAAAWGSRIALSKGTAEAVAQLPAATALTTALTACCLAWGDGAVASLAASFEAGRPGGNLAQAGRWFDEASRLSAGRQAAVPLARAEALAQPAGDRDEFERLVREAIAIANQFPGSDNQIMLERARWLLDTLDDRF